jgi:hypothetical protein
VRILPWPNAAKMAFTIRDDDISYFTSPQQLNILYGEAFEKGFKVSLSAIPMHAGSSDLNVPPDYRGKDLLYSIADNEDLVRFTQNPAVKDKIDIVQHGYSHKDMRKFDISQQNKEFAEMIWQGKLILEKTFNNKITVFVPPWEYLTKDNLAEISRIDMCLSMAPLKFLLLQKKIKNYGDLFKTLFFGATKRAIFDIEVLTVDGITNIGTLYNHAASIYENLGESQKSFRRFEKILDSVYSRNGCLAIGNHYWQYFYDWNEVVTNQPLKQYFDMMFKAVDSKKSVWKTSLSEIASWATDKKSISVIKNGNNVEIFSSRELHGLTLRLCADEKIIEAPSDAFIDELIDGECMDKIYNLKTNQKIIIKTR